MHGLLEVILAFLAVAGLAAIGWLFYGHLLLPAGGAEGALVLPGQGDGEELEQALLGALWLRESGLFSGKVVIADCGLTPAGLEAAERLTFGEAGVCLCRDEALGALLDKAGQQGS